LSQNLDEQQLIQQQQALYQQQLQQQQALQQQSAPGSQAVGAPQPQAGDSLWEFADIGFDTMKRLWFLQLFDTLNQNVGFYTAKSVSLNRGCAIQYQWKDTQGRPFWHVRERFQSSDVEGFQIDMKGNLVINFRKDHGDENITSPRIPKDFAYLQYAYHLTTKETPQSLDKSPMGFVEFCNQAGEVIGRVNNRWIIVEDANRRTTGELPKIRIRVDRKDIGRIILSRSSIIIMSKDGTPSETLEIAK
jgi:hypothetical protein